MRVGIEPTGQTPVYWNSTSVTYSFTIWTENQYQYSDNQTLTWSGAVSGSIGFNNGQGGGAVARVGPIYYTYYYPASSYGSSPGSTFITAQVTGTYNGIAPVQTYAWYIAARPFTVPAAPSNLSASRINDNSVALSWIPHGSYAGPYGSQTILSQYFSAATNSWSAYVPIATVSGAASSYTVPGLQSNTIYNYAIRANNGVGSSGYAYSGQVWMTPGPPANVQSALDPSGSSVTTTWDSTAFVTAPPVTFDIERASTAAGPWTSVATGLTTKTYTDQNPNPGSNIYRVRTVNPSNVSSGASLPSAWVNGNSISTIVAPKAPTGLDPNGVPRDFTLDQTFTWTHHDGGDKAPQTHFSIQYSTDGGQNWTPLVTDEASSESSYTIPANTLSNGEDYLWQVQTEGVVSAGYGPWSPPATVQGSTTPTGTITDPTEYITALPITVTWIYNQNELSPQNYWLLRLVDPDSGTVLEELSGNDTSTSASFSYPAEDGQSFTITLQVRSEDGLYSEPYSVTVTVQLPVPATVTTTPEYKECLGTVILHLTADDPLPAPPDVYNEFTNPNFESVTGDTVQVPPNTGPEYDVPVGVTADTGSSVTPYSYGDAGNRSAGLYIPDSLSGAVSVALVGPTDVSASTFYSARVSLWTDAGVDVPLRLSGQAGNGAPSSVVMTAVTVTLPADGSPVEAVLLASAETPSDATELTLFVSNTASTPDLAGTSVFLDNVLVQEVSAAGESPRSYFSGDSTNESTYIYSWEGDAEASRSEAEGRAETEVSSVTIQRRLPGSDWVTLVNDLTLPNDFIDILPSTTGLNEYRIIAANTAPAYRTLPIVEVQGTDGQVGDGLWAFVAYGAAFAKVLRVHGELSIKNTTGLDRGNFPLAGRRWPIGVDGENAHQAIDVSGSLFYDEQCPADDPEDCRHDSPPSDWEDAALTAGLVCYRDYTGRRIFGAISDVDTEAGYPGMATVGFKVTREDYTEQYGITNPSTGQ